MTDGPGAVLPRRHAEVRREGPPRRRQAVHRAVAERQAGGGASRRRSPASAGDVAEGRRDAEPSPTRSTPSTTRTTRMRGGRTTSSAAIRTTDRCRSITSCGRSRGRSGPSCSTPASTRRWARSGSGSSCARPSVGLKAIGVEPGDVRDVILSHMHYDHCGNYDLFPHARYHLQDIEMAYCTGRCMCHAGLRGPFEEDGRGGDGAQAVRRPRRVPRRRG